MSKIQFFRKSVNQIISIVSNIAFFVDNFPKSEVFRPRSQKSVISLVSAECERCSGRHRKLDDTQDESLMPPDVALLSQPVYHARRYSRIQAEDARFNLVGAWHNY